MCDDYIGGRPSAVTRTILATQAPLVRQTPSTSTTTTDTTPTPTNSSSQATNIPNTSQDVDELETQQHVEKQDNAASLQHEMVVDHVPNAMFDGNTFVNHFTTPSTSAAESSSSQYVDPSSMHTPDIVHATCLCARYQAKPTEKHLKEVKRIFCYLWGTVNMGLWYTKVFGFELTRFSDADYAGCKDTFKSTSGGAQFLGEKLVSWFSKKQDCMALSTAKEEYMSLSTCCAQVLWMRTQLTDYGFQFKNIPIYCDSKSAITISCNPV
nr:uncharacterized mitochondrial protein AtMg00810-like [Tanacetum cinerariifolium]